MVSTLNKTRRDHAKRLHPREEVYSKDIEKADQLDTPRLNLTKNRVLLMGNYDRRKRVPVMCSGEID